MNMPIIDDIMQDRATNHLKPRDAPYVWVSWLTKLLAGEASCVWSVWLRAHFITTKAPNGFDMGGWQMDHSSMLRKSAADHENAGCKVYTEDQNLFYLKGKAGTLSGKPDVVAVKGQLGLVVDTKTGSPKASDRIQVMIYMWALPRANRAFAGVRFDGMVVYKTGQSVIKAEEIDSDFVRQLVDLMKEVCGEEAPHKAPSFKECKFCPLAPEDCMDRVRDENIFEAVTDEF